MLQIEKILFPTDHSACAERAFLHAAVLADWHDAKLHALHVAEANAEDGSFLGRLRFSDEEIAEELRTAWTRSEARSRKDAAAEKLRLVTKQVEAPSAPDAILRYAEDEDADLIVMGTHGRRGVRRLMLGSVAEEVVRRAACPVLTVRTGEEDVPYRTVQRVLAPVDFSAFTPTAVAYAVELAQTYGARIDLLHVVEDATRPGAYGEGARLVVDVKAFKERAYDALAKLAREHIGFEDVRVAVEVGHPAGAVLRYAEAHATDLIVIPTHGRSGIQRMLLGSVAEKVVRQAPCPVFTVKSFGKSLLGKPERTEMKKAEG